MSCRASTEHNMASRFLMICQTDLHDDLEMVGLLTLWKMQEVLSGI